MMSTFALWRGALAAVIATVLALMSADPAAD